jgi:hypothetical protein
MTHSAVSESNPPRRILPSVGAVVAGFVATFILSVGTDAVMHAAGVLPPLGQAMSDTLFVLATAYRALFTVVGGYLTARLAPRRPMAHAMALGAIGLVAATLGAAATWGRGPAFGPAWYSIGIVVMALPCVWLGARIRTWQLTH